MLGFREKGGTVFGRKKQKVTTEPANKEYRVKMAYHWLGAEELLNQQHAQGYDLEFITTGRASLFGNVEAVYVFKKRGA